VAFKDSAAWIVSDRAAQARDGLSYSSPLSSRTRLSPKSEYVPADEGYSSNSGTQIPLQRAIAARAFSARLALPPRWRFVPKCFPRLLASDGHDRRSEVGLGRLRNGIVVISEKVGVILGTQIF
jgi:hypothetical protein